MGRYLNPPNCSKENWLAANAEPLGVVPPSTFRANGKIAVCFVDNGMFTAAALIYDQKEYDCFTHFADLRQKFWYWIDEELEDSFK